MLKKVIKGAFVLICIGSLLGFIWMTDMNQVILQIRSIGFGFLGLLCLSAMAHLCGTLAWRNCFNDSSSISVISLFMIRVIGENITLFNPSNLVAGEASKYQLLKKLQIEKQEGINSILFSRMILIISHVLLILICVSWIAVTFGFLMQFVIGLLIVLFLTSIICYGFHSLFFRKIVKDNKHRFRLMRVIMIYLMRYRLSFQRFLRNKPKVFVSALGFSTAHWLFGAGEIFLILEFLNIPISFFESVVIDMGVVLMKSVGGFVPGQIGVEEIGNKWMLGLAGVTGSIWIAVSILRRGKQLVWILLSALFYFIIRNYFIIEKRKVNGHIIYNA